MMPSDAPIAYAGHRQALDHAKRIRLEDGAVHERAGVAFVAVADDVLR